MWRILRRGILPVLLLSGGIASLVYGVVYHEEKVVTQQEIEIDLAPPEMDEPMEEPGESDEPDELDNPAGPDDSFGFDDPMGPGGPPGGGPPDMMPPELPPELRKMKQIVVVSTPTPEMDLIRDVTIGGLKRLESGELMRTYTGTPPSLCPT